MRRLRFYLAHLVPRVHWTTYTETATGQRYLAVWRQWGTHCWGAVHKALA